MLYAEINVIFNFMYIYELENWPDFFWDYEDITERLIQVRHQQGRLIGRMESIGFRLREETILQTITQDIVKSSEIEGEFLDQSLVRSSVARHLGMDVAADIVDKNIEGVVEMMLDATQNWDQHLTKKRLFSWHEKLFPQGLRFKKIRIGSWREGNVQVVSGSMGKEIIHFEAPLGSRVDCEMTLFLRWLKSQESIDLVLKAAIAHLWFVTIHPFEDGNGRIGRAIADLLLARSEKSSQRFYSLSSQIQKERKEYYTILEKTQKGGLDITPWIKWFLDCLKRAIEDALVCFSKIKIWEAIANIPLNERQKKVINRILDGFEGKLTSSKWAKLTKCSQDTAYRDILDLIDRGILAKNPGKGRSTSYALILPEIDKHF